MAQGLVFAESKDGKWFYILEDHGAPSDTWDWMEYAQCFGPFDALQEAAEHEFASSSDTSGAEIIEYGARGLGEAGARLIEKAASRKTPQL